MYCISTVEPLYSGLKNSRKSKKRFRESDTKHQDRISITLYVAEASSSSKTSKNLAKSKNVSKIIGNSKLLEESSKGTKVARNTRYPPHNQWFFSILCT